MLDLIDPTYGHFWLALGLVLVILEVVVPGYTLFCLGLAAIVPAVMAYLGVGSLALLLGAYSVCSFAFLYAIRPLILDKALKPDEEIETNVHALVGMRGIVTVPIAGDIEPGYVRVQSEEWRAVSAGPMIPKGACVVVRSFKGVTVTVELVVPGEDCPERGN